MKWYYISWISDGAIGGSDIVSDAVLQDSIQVHLTANHEPFTVLTCELGSGHVADGSACFLDLEESRIRTKIQSTGVKLLLWLFSNTWLSTLKSAIATSPVHLFTSVHFNLLWSFQITIKKPSQSWFKQLLARWRHKSSSLCWLHEGAVYNTC